MANVAQEWYAKQINYFGDSAKTTLLTIDANTNNILFVDVPQIQMAYARGDKPSPAVLAGYGYAGKKYWLTRDRPSRELTSAIYAFGKVAGGWFTTKGDKVDKGYSDTFTTAMKTLKAGFKKLADADAQVAGAYKALMFEDLDPAQKLATRADRSAKDGQALVTKALKILGDRSLLAAVSPEAEVPKVMPEPKVPVDPLNRLTPQVPEEHRAEFAERLAYFRVLKEQRLALFTGCRTDVVGKINWLPSALAPPCAEDLPPRLIRAAAAARTSFSSSAGVISRDTILAIAAFASEGDGWFAGNAGSQDFATQTNSLAKGFAMFIEAEKKLIEAYQAIEAQIAAKETDFSEAQKLSQEADSTAGEGATQIEENLAALGKLL